MTKKPQLRGQNLLDTIEACIRELAAGRDRYTYNASEVARLIGCSRPTLNAKTDFIDKVLNTIGAEKRLRSEHPLLEQFRGRIEDLENEKTTLENELQALRNNHAQIYTTLLSQSIDASVLINPIIREESLKRGKCTLCDQKISENHKFPVKSSVIQLDSHRHVDN